MATHADLELWWAGLTDEDRRRITKNDIVSADAAAGLRDLGVTVATLAGQPPVDLNTAPCVVPGEVRAFVDTVTGA